MHNHREFVPEDQEYYANVFTPECNTPECNMDLYLRLKSCKYLKGRSGGTKIVLAVNLFQGRYSLQIKLQFETLHCNLVQYTPPPIKFYVNKALPYCLDWVLSLTFVTNKKSIWVFNLRRPSNCPIKLNMHISHESPVKFLRSI